MGIAAAALPQENRPAVSVVEPATTPVWPLWQRVLFRFFFTYLLLQTSPWDFFSVIPGVSFVLRPVNRAIDWAVHTANDRVFHVRETLVPVNGSGDTSWAYAQLWLYLSLAVLACVIWSIADRRRPNYERALYWLRLVVRYYIAAAALSYGIIKLYALQMPFPTLSQLSTPLGDLLPMRFSWLFIGYSFRYQFFSGAMETVAGLLLLHRRTVTVGLLAASGAFLNVVMINLSYDVPVKLFASHLLFASLFMLALDAPRLVNFLVLNRPTPPTAAYEPPFTAAWQRWGARAVWAFFVWQILISPWRDARTSYQRVHAPPVPGPIKVGVYAVRHYVVNKDTVPPGSADSLRWKDVIFDNIGAGSVNTTDQVFWRRYGRGYFRYRADTAKRVMAVWKTSTIPRDSTFLFTMRYEVPDTSTVRLHTVIRGDSIHVELIRVPRHFQLAERQFHWLSEYNR